MFYTIYRITNKINGKIYIGMHKTDNLEDGYMGSGKLIKRAIVKYGIENFVKEILHIFDNETDMKNKEKELVVVSEETYNLLEGGHGGFTFINKNNIKRNKFTSESAKEANRILNSDPEKKKRWHDAYMKSISTEEYKLKASLSRKGIHAGDKNPAKKIESRIKMKESHKKNGHAQGEKNSQYGTCWITNGSENKKIKKEDLDFWLEKGYHKGRVCG